MEQKSRFSTSFVGKTVQSGSKVSGSIHPTLVVTSTKDKFNLNQKGLAYLGATEGSYVVLIDVNKGEVTTEESNDRFFITLGWKKAAGIEGAKIGKGGTFSYAGVYSAMQLNKPDISEATVKDMVAAGVGITRETPGGADAFIATQKVTFKIERLVVEGEDGELIKEFEVAPGVIQPVFCLTERSVDAHDPKEPSGSEDNE